MGKYCTLVDSKLFVEGKEEEGAGDGIELSLELSLGGRYENRQNLQKITENPFGEDSNYHYNEIGGSVFYCDDDESSTDLLNKRRRELQALRRREARLKREEKIKKSLLEGQRFQGRVQDREMREKEDGFLSRKNQKNELNLSLCSSNQQMQTMDCTSSLDYQTTSSSSQRGGSSSDSGSHSSPVPPRNISESSSDLDTLEGNNNNYSSFTKPNKILEHAPEHQSEKSKLTTCPNQISLTPPPPSNYKSNRTLKRPPKPPSQNPIPRSVMPCVSAKGNGPNGKTVTGFLCKYNKTEVVITCVCHGTSFSPAEFVEHAGGVNVSHPLRHITMIGGI